MRETIRVMHRARQRTRARQAGEGKTGQATERRQDCEIHLGTSFAFLDENLLGGGKGGGERGTERASPSSSSIASLCTLSLHSLSLSLALSHYPLFALPPSPLTSLSQMASWASQLGQKVTSPEFKKYLMR